MTLSCYQGGLSNVPEKQRRRELRDWVLSVNQSPCTWNFPVVLLHELFIPHPGTSVRKRVAAIIRRDRLRAVEGAQCRERSPQRVPGEEERAWVFFVQTMHFIPYLLPNGRVREPEPFMDHRLHPFVQPAIAKIVYFIFYHKALNELVERVHRGLKIGSYIRTGLGPFESYHYSIVRRIHQTMSIRGRIARVQSNLILRVPKVLHHGRTK
mmetsp:Transcript_7384/g.32839  ORF Transcript_7384/g.32839 Transcript_7384/m.32839 type:complete len:210 (-) Transcript_7384:2659-3288(-)